MSEYVPQVGDRVRWTTWSPKAWVDVLHIDGMDLFGRDERGAPTICALDDGDNGDPDGRWVKVPTFPERWINVYAGYSSCGHESRGAADLVASADRLGVIHLHPDGTLTMESAEP